MELGTPSPTVHCYWETIPLTDAVSLVLGSIILGTVLHHEGKCPLYDTGLPSHPPRSQLVVPV